MEKLMEMRCCDFLQQLSDKAPVPGGGGAAAQCGAMSAALCAMAARLTVGKKKYQQFEQELQERIAHCDWLREQFQELVQADADGFLPLQRAYSLPKNDPKRAETLELASLIASLPPLSMLECCEELAGEIARIAEICSPLVVSDTGCAAALCRAAAETAALNVFVNTASHKTAAGTHARAKQLLRRVQQQTAALYDGVRARLQGEEQHG